MVDAMQQYLTQVQEQLVQHGSRKARILDEIAAHLLEGWEHEQERGVPAEEALALVLERFGSPALIGKQFAQLEKEHQLWQGKHYLQQACWFLAPLLFCCLIGGLTFVGYDAPRLAFIHLTDSIANELAVLHLWFVGVLMIGWLSLGGPLVCAISGMRGIVALRSWSWVTCLNILFTVLGLALLLFDLYSLITD